MTQLELDIADWHSRKYGPVNLPKTYRKLLEEVGELGEALMEGDAKHIQEEAGDVAFVLCHIIREGCFLHPSLTEALELALAKCIDRETVKHG